MARRHVEGSVNVRITVDIDEDLLLAVEERRTACKTTGQVLADLARQALQTSAPEPASNPVRDVSSDRDAEDRVPTLTRV